MLMSFMAHRLVPTSLIVRLGLAWAICFPWLLAAQSPVEIIPITKVRVHYFIPAEDGNGKSCGVQLHGTWPVYRNYTNLSSYNLVLPGLQGIRSWIERTPAVGGEFRFYAYFNGVSTPFNDSPCPDTIGEQHPDWYAELRRQPPRASFTASPVLSDPGVWNFQSTSTDPEDQPLTESWVFGDGGTAGGLGEVYRYRKPGTFTASLTVTDTDGLTNRASRSMVVPAPKPVVSVRLLNKHTGNRIELGEEFGVRVIVRATEDGVGALSSLVFSGPALFIPGLFSILSAPQQTEIGTLEPGQSREFNWTLRADLAGEFALSAPSVTGRDASNRSASGSGAVARGEVTSLIVGIEQRPPRLVLGADNNKDGKTNELDRRVELIVGITNVTRQDVTDVRAVIVNDPIQLTSLAQDLNIWITPLQVPPGEFGTIPPGAANAVHRTNVYEATDRTYAEASILLQGKVGDAGVQTRGEGLVNVGGETLVEARFDVENREYRSGQLVRVFGSLKNVSRFRNNRGEVLDEGKTVGVVVYPTVDGNGVGGYCVPADSGGRTPDGPTTFLLAPDESIDIAAILPTAEIPTNTTLTVTYQVAGYVHGEGPKPRRMKPTDIEVVEDSEKGWSARHEVKLAGVPVVTDPWLVCPTELSFAGFVSCRLTEGLGNAGGSLVDLGLLVGTGLKEIAVGTVRLAAWKIWAVEQLFKGLEDPAARLRLAREIIIDLQALKAVGVESLQGIELAAESIGPAIERAIIDAGRTIESGDLKQIAGGLARITGENIDVPLEALVAARAVRKALVVREGLESAAKEALENSFEKQAQRLGGTVDDYAARGALGDLPTSDDLPTGVNVVNEPRVYRDGYGARKEDVDGYLAVAKEEGVVLTFRSRAPKSAEYLDAGTHLLKPGGVSIKTVSEIDRRFLGFPDRFEAECALVEPPIPWMNTSRPEFADIANNYLNRFPELNGGDEASVMLRAEVYERLKFQLDEWPKQAENFTKYAREGIDVNFHAQKQRLGLGKHLLPNKEARRAARLEPHVFTDPFTGKPRNAYRLLMEEAPGSGRFMPITGDVDFLAILNPDGSMPGLFKRLRVYRKMIALGMQHGESFSFFKKDLRDKFLRCCTPRAKGGDGEKMLAATPYGELLTTQFQDAYSVIEGGPNAALRVDKGEFTFLTGTVTEVYTLERTASEVVSKTVRRDAVPLVTASALARMVDELNAAADRANGKPVRMGPDGQPEIYDPSPGGAPPALLRASRRAGGPRLAAAAPGEAALEAELDRLESSGWVSLREVPPRGAAGGQWRPATPEEARGAATGSGLRVSPYTYLTEDVPAGTEILPVLTSGDVGFPAPRPLFAVGDEVVVDPGGSREEFATVTGVQPFTLSRPLKNVQEAGTMILFLAGLPDARKVPGTLPSRENLLVWLRADAGLELSGTNVLSWTDQSRNRFVFRPPDAASQPGWVGDSTNGIPGVRFNGTGDPELRANLDRTLTNATIFSLVRFLNSSTSTRYVYAFGTRNFSGLMMTLARRLGDDVYHYDGAAEWVTPNVIPGLGFRVFSQVYGEDGADRHRLAVNGRMVLDNRTTVGRAYSAVATNVVLGRYPGIGSFGGDLVEWIIYDRSLSSTERLEVEDYLRQRAGLPPLFQPGSLDLSGFETVSESGGAATTNWVPDLAGRGVIVSPGAASPTLLLSPPSLNHGELKARLGSSGSTGFLGFAFGWIDSGNFLLFDWNRLATNHPVNGFAPAGMRLREFHLPEGQEPTPTDFWSSPDPLRVTVLATNRVAWGAGTNYDLTVRLFTGRFELSVEAGTNLLAAWSVETPAGLDGRFGFYAANAPGARFSDLRLPGSPLQVTEAPASPGTAGRLAWIHGSPPFVVQSRTNLAEGDWIDVTPATLNQSQELPALTPPVFLRVRGWE